MKNEQKLISHYELFETAKRYTGVTYSSADDGNIKFKPLVKAYSLLHDEVPKGRSCKDIVWFKQDEHFLCNCRHDWTTRSKDF